MSNSKTTAGTNDVPAQSPAPAGSPESYATANMGNASVYGMTAQPSYYDIYTPDVQLADPTGVQTRGLTSYKQFFGMIRLFRRVMIQNVGAGAASIFDGISSARVGDPRRGPAHLAMESEDVLLASDPSHCGIANATSKP